MGKFILQITYDVKPELRDQYLALAKEMQSHFAGERKKAYSVFEQKGKKNSFVEQFVCMNAEDFERLEDDMDETSEGLVNRLEALLKDGSARYSTLVEME